MRYEFLEAQLDLDEPARGYLTAQYLYHSLQHDYIAASDYERRILYNETYPYRWVDGVSVHIHPVVREYCRQWCLKMQDVFCAAQDRLRLQLEHMHAQRLSYTNGERRVQELVNFYSLRLAHLPERLDQRQDRLVGCHRLNSPFALGVWNTSCSLPNVGNPVTLDPGPTGEAGVILHGSSDGSQPSAYRPAPGIEIRRVPPEGFPRDLAYKLPSANERPQRLPGEKLTMPSDVPDRIPFAELQYSGLLPNVWYFCDFEIHQDGCYFEPLAIHTTLPS